MCRVTLLAVTLLCCLTGCLWNFRVFSDPQLDATRNTQPPETAPKSLRIMSYNIAHGSGLAPHPSFLRKDEFAPNLAILGELIRRERVHIASLQEVDFECSTGFFDHLPVLREESRMAHSVGAPHANIRFAGATLVYGTALLSNTPLQFPESGGFDTERNDFQGYSVASIEFPGTDTLVDVWSVHLSPGSGAGARQRRAQMDLVVEIAQARGRPIIMTGDMNCAWVTERPCVQYLAERLGLRGPSQHLATYPSTSPEEYYDWILVSDPMQIDRYEVLSDRTSDHLPVIASIRWTR